MEERWAAAASWASPGPSPEGLLHLRTLLVTLGFLSLLFIFSFLFRKDPVHTQLRACVSLACPPRVLIRWWDELRASHTPGECSVTEPCPCLDLANSPLPSSTSRQLPWARAPYVPTSGSVLPAHCSVLVPWSAPPMFDQSSPPFLILKKGMCSSFSRMWVRLEEDSQAGAQRFFSFLYHSSQLLL